MSRLLIEDRPLQVLPKLAVAIGLNEAMFIQQVYFLTSHPNSIVKDGKRWFFKSVEAMQEEMFPFWSTRTIKRIIAKCITEKYLYVEKINAHKNDQTNWYSVNYDTIDELKSLFITEEEAVNKEPSDCAKMAQSRVCQNGTIHSDKMAQCYKEKEIIEKDNLKENIIVGEPQQQALINLLNKQIRIKLQRLAIEGYIEFEHLNDLASQVLDFTFNRDQVKYGTDEKAINLAISLIKQRRWRGISR